MAPTGAIHWMHYALRLAEGALPADVPVGAVIVDAKGQVLGEGYNRREQAHDPTAHAELIALAQAGKAKGDWRLTDATLYVTLEPCPMCFEALVQARVGKVVFGAWATDVDSVTRINRIPQYEGGVCESLCREQLLAHFQSATHRS